MHLLLLDPTLMCLNQEQATNGGSRTEQPGSGGLLPGVRLLFTNQPEKEKKHRERGGSVLAQGLWTLNPVAQQRYHTGVLLR